MTQALTNSNWYFSKKDINNDDHRIQTERAGSKKMKTRWLKENDNIHSYRLLKRQETQERTPRWVRGQNGQGQDDVQVLVLKLGIQTEANKLSKWKLSSRAIIIENWEGWKTHGTSMFNSQIKNGCFFSNKYRQ